MTIGELARRSGLTTSRIRFYESIGLLTAVDRRANGYRSYPPEAETVLALIAGAQKAGFALDEIRTLIPRDLRNWEHDALLSALRRKVADIEAMEIQLAASKTDLLAVIEAVETRPEDVACADNAKRVLTTILHERTDIAAEGPAMRVPRGRRKAE